VFDVGGFRGYTAAWFAREAQRVFCFEANPTNQDQIADLLRVRHLSNTELVRCAVSDHAGRATLYVKPFGGHHALADIGASKTIDRVEVAVTTLDHFAAERGIDRIALLKVDVEGFEPDVLRGAKQLFARRAIAGVLFEFSPQFYKQRGIDPIAPVRILADYGYRVEAPNGKSITESELQSDDQRDLFAFPIEETGSKFRGNLQFAARLGSSSTSCSDSERR
jgi:FkbM family methyltransferase